MLIVADNNIQSIHSKTTNYSGNYIVGMLV